MVVGVATGFTRKLALMGTGYRAQSAGKLLTLNVGYSNPRVLDIPEGIKVSVSSVSCGCQFLSPSLALNESMVLMGCCIYCRSLGAEDSSCTYHILIIFKPRTLLSDLAEVPCPSV